MNYYNEFDKDAAQWLRNLIGEGLIPNGDVDERSITEVQASDLTGYTQCHFFAGIGGWSLALQLAGWPATRSVWTGSCPCQPYSAAGDGEGINDERDLWPQFDRLIGESEPDVVFGEQVENAIKHGWLDRVQADMEAKGYAVGAVVLGSHSIGAPHIRPRLYWAANSCRQRLQGRSITAKNQRTRGTFETRREIAGTRFEIAAGRSAWKPEPQPEPVAYGVPARVVRLRGYGNAVDPRVAAEFISAFCAVAA